MATSQVTEPALQGSDQADAALIGLYTAADAQILGAVTRLLKSTPATAQASLLPKLRRITRQVIESLTRQTPPAINAVLQAAAIEGREHADQAVSKALERVGGGAGGSDGKPPIGNGLARGDDGLFDLRISHAERSAQAIRDDLVSSLDDVTARLTRLPDDIYKAIAPHGAIGQVLDNAFTPPQAQSVAWRVFTANGVTGFTDRANRNWALSSYVEMAVRTASQRAYNVSNLDRLHAYGLRYFTVLDDGHPCPLCFPWQHKVLVDENEPPTDGKAIPDATIAQARAGGLWHPNCRHTLAPYFPGITDLPDLGTWTPELADRYKATQKQRALEVEIRKAKRSAQYALNPEVRTEAIADVRRLQSRMRDHLAANSDLNRRSRREQVDLRDDRMKLPRPSG